jgi:hypothetical protein
MHGRALEYKSTMADGRAAVFSGWQMMFQAAMPLQPRRDGHPKRPSSVLLVLVDRLLDGLDSSVP